MTVKQDREGKMIIVATFAAWLSAQDGRQDGTGELARRWAADTAHGNISTPTGVSRRITAAWGDDADQAKHWLAVAVEEYNAARTGEAAPAAPKSSDPVADAILRRLREQSAEIAWLRVAITYLLPADALEAMAALELDGSSPVSAPQPEPDWAGMLAAADLTAEADSE